MIILGVLIGILMVWAKIFRFGIRLPTYPELSPFAPHPHPVPRLPLESSWEQLGNFSSSVGDQCRTFSFPALVKKQINMSAAPGKPREKTSSEGVGDVPEKDDGGSKKRWHRSRHNRAMAKKAKRDEDVPKRDGEGVPNRDKKNKGSQKRDQKIPKAQRDEEVPPPTQQESPDLTLKPGKPRPNVFLALRLSNPEIHYNVRRFQENFLADNPKLGRLCVPVQKSHVSLQVDNVVHSSNKGVI